MNSLATSDRHRVNARRGSIVVVIATSMVPLFGLMALGLDVGMAWVSGLQLQVASDAAALAGASALGDDAAAVERRAIEMAAMHVAAGRAVQLAAAEVELGTWDPGSETFTVGGEPPDAVRVRAQLSVQTSFTGFLGVATLGITREAIASADSEGAGGGCGFFGNTSLQIGNAALIDSYDSRLGPYAAPGYANARACTNGDAQVSDEVNVYGDVLWGPDESGQIQSGTVHGSVGPLDEEIPFPWVDTAQAAASNDNGLAVPPLSSQPSVALKDSNVLRLPGSSDPEAPNVYFMKDLQIDGQARIEIDPAGYVEIWVDGSVQLGGGGVLNPTNNPHHLAIFATNSIQVSGDSSLYGAFISNNSVSLSNDSDLFGLIAAGNGAQYSNDTAMHLDESLPSRFGLTLPGTASVHLVH